MYQPVLSLMTISVYLEQTIMVLGAYPNMLQFRNLILPMDYKLYNGIYMHEVLLASLVANSYCGSIFLFLK